MWEVTKSRRMTGDILKVETLGNFNDSIKPEHCGTLIEKSTERKLHQKSGLHIHVRSLLKA